MIKFTKTAASLLSSNKAAHKLVFASEGLGMQDVSVASHLFTWCKKAVHIFML